MGNPYNGNGCGYDGCGYGIGVPMPSTAVPLLLDDLPQFRIAVATKKLRTDYSGDCFQVRRSGDSSTANYGFVDGVVDSASYDTFCGAGDGFLAAWYDQSGSGNNLTQATTSAQPRVVSSGSVEAINDNLGVFGHTGGISLDSGPLTYTRPFHRFCVVSFLAETNYQFLFDGQGNNVASLSFLQSSTTLEAYNGTSLTKNAGSALANQTVIVEALFNGASSRLRINDTTASTGSTGTGTMPTKVRLMNAGASASFGLNFYMHSFLEFDGQLTTEQVTAVRDGLNSLYGVF